MYKLSTFYKLRLPIHINNIIELPRFWIINVYAEYSTLTVDLLMIIWVG